MVSQSEYLSDITRETDCGLRFNEQTRTWTTGNDIIVIKRILRIDIRSFIMNKLLIFISLQVPGSDDVDLPGGDLEAANPILENADSSKDQELIQNGSASPVSESPKRNSPPINLQSPPVRVNRNYAESLQRQPSRSSLASIKSRVMVSEHREQVSAEFIDLFQNKVPSNMKSSPEATALKVFVVLLFSLCFAIVLVAHILYNQHIGEVNDHCWL